MKTRFAILALVASMLMTASAYASGGAQITSVPFDFYLGDKVMPAGTYTIRPLNGDFLVFTRDGKGEQSHVTLTRAVGSNENYSAAKLVFRRVGDQYFLVEVWNSSTETGRTIQVSPKQVELARKGSSLVEMGSK